MQKMQEKIIVKNNARLKEAVSKLHAKFDRKSLSSTYVVISLDK